MKKKTLSYWRVASTGILKLVLFFFLIFWIAGTWDYWQGWLFIILTLIASLIMIYIFRGRTDLMKERLQPGPNMKWWDKVFWAINIPLYLVLMVVAVLDAGRYGWTESLPVWLYIANYIIHYLGYVIIIWAMWINDYFSSVVRIQKDRGQKVIDKGPYKYVRHPGYVGGMLITPTISLALGSLWGLIPSAVAIILFIIRTYLEDKTLQKELDGYKEYTKKTRYRLIPGIW